MDFFNFKNVKLLRAQVENLAEQLELERSTRINAQQQLLATNQELRELKDAVIYMLQYKYAGKRHPRLGDLRWLGALCEDS